ncbi:hypothetical protein ACFQMA_04080 [Halosimplex aquaticum]|uniref:TIGR04206 family protein n=1 Tax=Halosimplex aquaticum TaxID=3026162 RepID=A0ABD5Y017_9EURY|nr:hypothetical protein [Halosimplex aquaticum]
MRRSDTRESPEERIDEHADETTLVPSAAGSVAAWAPGLDYRDPDTDDPALAGERADRESYRGGDDDGGWWDEGLITALIVAGAVLFVIPEPATSGIGILLLAIGVLAWLVDLAIPGT